MKKRVEIEPCVSPEQEKAGMLLSELSSKFQELIEEKRNKALEKLLEESCSKAVKTIELNDYFSFRMAPNEYSVQGSDGVTYFLPQMIQIAQSLYDDRTFIYSDSSLVLDNLDFFSESINYVDIVLAYHYYRLSKDDVSLSHLVKLIGFYAEYAFEMDGLRINFPVSDKVLSHDESINHLDSIIMFVDSYLQRYGEERKLFYGKFELNKETRIGFSSRIDNDAMQSFMKKSPLDIRKSKLTDYLSGFASFDALDEFYLYWLFDKLYTRIVIKQDTEYEELASVQWPTFTDLLSLAENESSQEKQRGEYSNKAYKRVIDVLNNICNRSIVSDLNAQIAITEEDFIESKNTNREVDTASVYNNIRRNIRFLFVVNMAAETIPEFSADKEKMIWRQSICRKLCDVFSDECAFERITKENEIDKARIIENESITEAKQKELIKSFLELSNMSSIESIMERRNELLDRARAIAPEDTAFLEKCSADILDRLQKVIQDKSLACFVEDLRKELNSGKKVKVSEDVLYTLATAEFLFSKYATDTFAEQGFDYSSISALYYQAFENAYNELIWRKYAEMLNSLLIGDIPFTTILDNSRDKRIKSPDAQGYLPDDDSDRKYYVKYKNKSFPSTLVMNQCMYESFGKLMKRIYDNSLPKFRVFMAELAGYKTIEMLNDKSYLDSCKSFSEKIIASAKKRNNASHGGTTISKDQCDDDKKTILNNLESVRNDNIGLIQQLLYLLNKKR